MCSTFAKNSHGGVDLTDGAQRTSPMSTPAARTSTPLSAPLGTLHAGPAALVGRLASVCTGMENEVGVPGRSFGAELEPVLIVFDTVNVPLGGRADVAGLVAAVGALDVCCSSVEDEDSVAVGEAVSDVWWAEDPAGG